MGLILEDSTVVAKKKIPTYVCSMNEDTFHPTYQHQAGYRIENPQTSSFVETIYATQHSEY